MKYLFLSAALIAAAGPSFASDFTITIKGSTTSDVPVVTATGGATETITLPQRAMFGIQFAPLDDAIVKVLGRGTSDIYLFDPTPFGDIFGKFGWTETTTTSRVTSASGALSSTEPQALSEVVFCNTSDVDGTFSHTLASTVSNTATTGWSESSEVGFSITATAKMEIEGTGGSVSDTLSLKSTSGTSGSTSQSTTITTGNAVVATLKPGQKAKAVLTAKKATLVATINYQISVSGSVFANYGDSFQAPGFTGNHHFYNVDLLTLMDLDSLPSSISQTQTISMDYFHSANASLEAYDGPCDSAITEADS